MKYIALFASLLLGVGGSAFATDNNGFLDVKDAFRLSTEATSAQQIKLHWDIAEGYYLYRDRIKVESQSDGVVIGTPEFPTAELKKDPNFGDVYVYHHGLDVTVPLTTIPAKTAAATLKIRYQGCAQAGLCYMPVTTMQTISLPSAAEPTTSTSPGLSALFASGEREFLPADKAFFFESHWEGQEAVLHWAIQPGYYLYRKSIEVVGEQPGVTLGAPILPQGGMKHDEHYGDVEIYEGDLTARVPVTFNGEIPPQLTFEAKYQGCADQGICYEPMKQKVSLEPKGTVAGTVANISSTAASTPPAALSEDEGIAKQLSDRSLFVNAILFYLLGLALAFTPCILPMVPILASIITGQGHKLSPARGFTLAMAYVQPMALTFAAAGVFVGMSGKQLNAILQSAPFLGTFGVVLILLALSMFGLFKLQIPNSIQAKVAELSNRQQGGSLVGVMIMGFLSSLIVGPCITPPLAGTLLYISQQGSPIIGAVVLYAMAFGMGTPLLLMGCSAGFLLPKVGAWMNRVQHTFGILILGLALWMTGPVVPDGVEMFLWGLLFVGAGVFYGALEPLGDKRTGWPVIGKMVGITALVYGVLIFYGFAQGARTPWQPLAGIAQITASSATPAATQPLSLFKRIKTVADLDREVATAAAAGKPVVLDYYADWCVACKEYEHITFVDPSVRTALSRVVALQADVTAGDEQDNALLAKFNILGPPTIVFYDKTGALHPEWKITGFKDATAFMDHLRQTILP